MTHSLISSRRAIFELAPEAPVCSLRLSTVLYMHALDALDTNLAISGYHHTRLPCPRRTYPRNELSTISSSYLRPNTSRLRTTPLVYSPAEAVVQSHNLRHRTCSSPLSHVTLTTNGPSCSTARTQDLPSPGSRKRISDIETPAVSPPPIKDTTEPSTLPISVRASVVPEKHARTRIQPAPALTLVRDACQGFSQQQRRPKRGNRPPDAFAVVY